MNERAGPTRDPATSPTDAPPRHVSRGGRCACRSTERSEGGHRCGSGGVPRFHKPARPPGLWNQRGRGVYYSTADWSDVAIDVNKGFWVPFALRTGVQTVKCERGEQSV